MLKVRGHADAWVVRRVLEGRREEFGVLVNRYLAVVHAVAYAHTGNRADAEEVAQDGFLSAFEKLDTLRETQKFGSWLIAIVRNACRERHKAEAKRNALLDGAALPRVEPTPEIERREVHAMLRQQMDQLDDVHREVLLMHYFAGKCIREIAALLDISPAAVKKRLQRAREHLSKHMLRQMQPDLQTEHRDRTRAARIMGIVAAAPVTWQPAATGGASSAATSTATVLGGVLLMKTKMELAVLILLLAGAAAWLGRGLYFEEGEGPQRLQAERVGDEWQPRVVKSGPEDYQPVMEHPESELASAGSAQPVAEVEGGVVRGRVYDKATNEGIPGVVVWVDTEGGQAPKVESEPTDADGAYAITGLAEAQYRVQRTTPEGYQEPSWHDKRLVTVNAETIVEGCDFALLKGAAVRGMAVDLEGQRVPGAEIRLAGGDEAYGYWEATTNNEGIFVFPGRSPDTGLSVAAKKGSFVSRALVFDLPEGGLADLVLKLGPSATVSGKVVDPAGRPKAGIDVIAWFTEGDRGMGSESATSGASGQFEVSGLAPGDYGLQLRLAGTVAHTGRWEGEHVKLDWGEHLQDLVLVYDRIYSISGRVTYEDCQPVEGAVVQADGGDLVGSPPGAQSEKTGPDGRYEIPDLPEGKWSLMAHHTGLGSFSQKVTDVPAGSRGIDLVVPSRFVQISGQVVCAVTGEPVPAFKIGLLPADADPYGRYRRIWATVGAQVIDEKGRFQLKTLKYGEKTLVVEAPGYLASIEPIVAAKGRDIRNIVIRLRPGGNVTGYVKTTQGWPVAGASVLIGPIREDVPVPPTATLTDSNGAFALETFPPGPQVVSVYHPDYAFGWTTVDARAQGAKPVEIVLSLGGTVEGSARWKDLQSRKNYD